jgi:hypothetical protein
MTDKERDALIKEIRKLDILIGNHREQLFRTQLIIKSFTGKRQALYDELGVVKEEGWDVT